jgi:hypothetical protein
MKMRYSIEIIDGDALFLLAASTVEHAERHTWSVEELDFLMV